MGLSPLSGDQNLSQEFAPPLPADALVGLAAARAPARPSTDYLPGHPPESNLLLRPSRGLILQDLTFVHLGNPDYIDGKVNFSKRWQQFNILDSMRCFQQA